MWAPQAISSGIGHIFSGEHFFGIERITCFMAMKFLAAMDQTFLETPRFA
jgi:hypothetical protein